MIKGNKSKVAHSGKCVFFCANCYKISLRRVRALFCECGYYLCNVTQLINKARGG